MVNKITEDEFVKSKKVMANINKIFNIYAISTCLETNLYLYCFSIHLILVKKKTFRSHHHRNLKYSKHYSFICVYIYLVYFCVIKMFLKKI